MTSQFLADGQIEIVRPDFRRGGYQAVLIDFDGTLSLIRRNWQDVMIPMMVDALSATGSGESRDQLSAHVEEFVMRLNGRQTIYQMIQLADEIRLRGGEPLEPLEYKHRYHDLLMAQIGHRREDLRAGTATPQEMAVPECHRLLEALRQAGLTLYLASGTDLKYVREEVQLLQLESFFGAHIYGALDEYKSFSKRQVIQQIIADAGVPGESLLGLGDGFVEIEEVKRVGGTAIGVASNEETRSGINEWKRDRLIRAGADLIVPDFRCRETLLNELGIA